MKTTETVLDDSQAGLCPNGNVAALPSHLKQFVVDQNYSKYTPVDHAVWRFIMRQSMYFLVEHAHKIYFDGLTNTGISLDRIPKIEEMNEILGRIGWGAVAVDGFIPPAAFMEFQAYCVLVIACDMRQINHIDYTPAPDIVHEAAGHAPIIIDSEYANYLQRFGEVGAKAMSSKADFSLYKAIRHLSILKESPDSKLDEIREAEKQVSYWQKNLGEPSEMALLSRLHWWTVEYGLIGSLEACKIYGAGLLSSIGESVSCLEPDVKKLPYSLDTVNYPFDITNKQPHLFVTPDFAHLYSVLEEFAASMAFTIGGLSGLNKAVECENVATAVYSSGLQVTGLFTDIISQNGLPVYLRTTGPSALALSGRHISGHGKDYHKDGFGSPVGHFKNCPRPPETLDDSALGELGIALGKKGSLEFESSIVVSGKLEQVIRENEKIILLSFSDCTVTLGDKVLFQPEWGRYDMAVGAKISSVFSGAADKDAFDQIAIVPKERTIKVTYTDKDRQLWRLYSQVAKIRLDKSGYETLAEIWREVRGSFPDDWLLTLQMVELLHESSAQPELKAEMSEYLRSTQKRSSELSVLIDWGFRLIDYHA